MADRDNDIVVVALARTPFGRFNGALKDIDAPALGALAINEVLARTKTAQSTVDVLYAGVGMIASAMLTPVRQAVLLSQLPETTPSATIDRTCCWRRRSDGPTADARIGRRPADLRLQRRRSAPPWHRSRAAGRMGVAQS